MKCEICGNDYKTLGGAFTQHLSTHTITPQEYYDKFLKRDNDEGYCYTCKKPTKFKSIDDGYEKFCCSQHNCYICQICNIIVNNSKGGFVNHLTKVHKVNIKEYYDIYLKRDYEGFCENCGNETQFIKFTIGYAKQCTNCQNHVQLSNKIKCELCGHESNKLGIHLHLSHPQITLKEYYDKYLKKPNEGKCLVCGKETEFLGLVSGYREHCCISCSQKSQKTKDKIETTNLEKYGVKNIFQRKDVQEKSHKLAHSKEANDKREQTNLERYGATNPFGSKEIIENRRKHMLEKYGVEYNLQIPEIHAKGIEAGQTPEVKKKRQETNLTKYGVKSIVELNEVRQKAGKGARTEKAINQRKETCLERYGAENPWQNPDIQEKRKQTCIEKYGVSNAGGSKETLDKIKQHNLEQYGVEHSWQRQDVRDKSYQTKKTNQNLDNELGDADE